MGDKLRFTSRSEAARYYRELGHADAWSVVDRLWRDGEIEISPDRQSEIIYVDGKPVAKM